MYNIKTSELNARSPLLSERCRLCSLHCNVESRPARGHFFWVHFLTRLSIYHLPLLLYFSFSRADDQINREIQMTKVKII